VLLDLCAAHPEVASAIYRAIADVLAERYRQTLVRLTSSSQRALKDAGFWANV